MTPDNVVSEEFDMYFEEAYRQIENNLQYTSKLRHTATWDYNIIHNDAMANITLVKAGHRKTALIYRTDRNNNPDVIEQVKRVLKSDQ